MRPRQAPGALDNRDGTLVSQPGAAQNIGGDLQGSVSWPLSSRALRGADHEGPSAGTGDLRRKSKQ